MLPVIRSIHQTGVHGRRVQVLARHLCDVLPPHASVIDIGAGDGLLARRVLASRNDLRWTAIDTLSRPTAHVPVQVYDGQTIPFDDNSFDVALFVDVLHHTDEPAAMLREAARVARRHIVIKDHLREGILANTRLRFMDWVGNAGWGVRLPYNYWNHAEWEKALHELRLTRISMRTSLGLYPWWADWMFGQSLHFIACVGVPGHD
jgi:SAM-dependent methyltransferase